MLSDTQGGVCECVCACARALPAVSLQLELPFCAKREEKLIYILKQKNELGVPVTPGRVLFRKLVAPGVTLTILFENIDSCSVTFLLY